MEAPETQTASTATPVPYDPFVTTETYRRTLYRPIKKPGDPPDEVIGWVELRGLNAGDRAEFNELKVTGGGSAGIDIGMIQLLMVDRAIVAWSFEKSKTVDTIRALEPDVFDQMWEHVSMGNPTLSDAVDELKGESDPLDGESAAETEETSVESD